MVLIERMCMAIPIAANGWLGKRIPAPFDPAYPSLSSLEGIFGADA
jgi:hypothetical protein